MKNKNITGVILAGGLNTRYGGRIKANEIIGGERIIVSVLKTIRPFFEDIIVVTNTPEAFTGLGECRMTGDIFRGKGPLGGIHAALNACRNDAVFVFAGDMPFLDGSLVEKMIGSYDPAVSEALIPVTGKKTEPLHAIYSVAVKDKLTTFLENEDDYTIRKFLSGIRTSYIELPADKGISRIFTNINSPEDLKKALVSTVTVSDLQDKFTRSKDNLLAILHYIQDRNGKNYISPGDIKAVASFLNLTLSEVYGVATYYSLFSVIPRGMNIIRVCRSPVCRMAGSSDILEILKEKLSLNGSNTTHDGLFTVETCECLGHCEEAPGMLVNREFHGNLDKERIGEIIKNIKKVL